MSKAFRRESDDFPEPQPIAPTRSVLPPGVKNYLTPAGMSRLQEELDRLVEVERPKMTTQAQDADTRQQIRALEQRINQLHECLHEAVVVTPPSPPWNQVRFGATVAVRHGDGSESEYRIVGVNETDADRGWVSWLSPIAKALINGKPGQQVPFLSPSGREQLEILDIFYE